MPRRPITTSCRMAASRPSAARRSRTCRSTINDFFFGRGDHGSEPGTPLNPLFSDLAADRQEHAAALESLTASPSPADLAEGKGLPHQQAGRRNCRRPISPKATGRRHSSTTSNSGIIAASACKRSRPGRAVTLEVSIHEFRV